jgi:hypothetical protein
MGSGVFSLVLQKYRIGTRKGSKKGGNMLSSYRMTPRGQFVEESDQWVETRVTGFDILT